MAGVAVHRWIVQVMAKSNYQKTKKKSILHILYPDTCNAYDCWALQYMWDHV